MVETIEGLMFIGRCFAGFGKGIIEYGTSCFNYVFAPLCEAAEKLLKWLGQAIKKQEGLKSCWEGLMKLLNEMIAIVKRPNFMDNISSFSREIGTKFNDFATYAGNTYKKIQDKGLRESFVDACSDFRKYVTDKLVDFSNFVQEQRGQGAENNEAEDFVSNDSSTSTTYHRISAIERLLDCLCELSKTKDKSEKKTASPATDRFEEPSQKTKEDPAEPPNRRPSM